MTRRFASIRCQSGISYIEALVATIIVGAAVIPASDALRGAMQSAEANGDATVRNFQLIAKMEQVLADPFVTLAAAAAGPLTPSTYSDPAGGMDRRLVFVSFYDADNADSDGDPFTGTEPDLLWVRVEVEGTVDAAESLVVE